MVVKRSIVVIVVLSLFLMVTSCGTQGPGDNTRDTAAALQAAQSGTQGVKASFVSGYPPNKIYDINDFLALIELENKGNYDLFGGDCFVKLTGFDPNIVRGIDYVQTCGELTGKNVYNLDGGFNQIEYQSTNIALPFGAIEYSPQLNLAICYEYQTRASPSICVDSDMYNLAPDQKACRVHDASLGGGQGAPVSVSYVGVDMAENVAVFEITVRNVGGGKVLSPYTPLSSCGEAFFDYNDQNKVAYTVQMTGGSLISCSPRDGIIRLNDAGTGKIVCKFRVNGASAFETPLSITLDYNYLDSIKRGVQIIQTP